MNNTIKSSLPEHQLIGFIPSNSGKKYRNSFEIIASILAIARKGATLFAITRYVNTNYTHLRKYLNFLIKIGFISIEINRGRVLYKTCDNGIEFLRVYRILLDMLSGIHANNELTNVVCEHVNRSLHKI
jgi:predicted transcriptional regulator